MRCLIGCEESGVLRRALRDRGHDAVSCDLLPARDGSVHHLQMDIMLCIEDDWDMIVLFPDCTKMSLSGNRWYAGTQERMDAIVWTLNLWHMARLHCRVGCAIENPASVLWRYIGSPQYIQPWQFGHGETKKTGILTWRLPPLEPTHIVSGREQRIWKMPPGPNRKRDRSETFLGIANAIADQWGCYDRP